MKTEKEIKERIEGLKQQIRFSVENTNKSNASNHDIIIYKCDEAINQLVWVLE